MSGRGRRRARFSRTAGELVEVDEFRDKDRSAHGQSDHETHECDHHVLEGEHFVRVFPVMIVGYRPERLRVHKPTVDDAALHERGDYAVHDVYERHVSADQVHDVERPRTFVHDVQEDLVVFDVRAGDFFHQIVFPPDRGRSLIAPRGEHERKLHYNKSIH